MTDQLALAQICSLYATDKNVLHSYVDNVYEDIFKDLRQSTKKMLEIGVETGGSLLMWREYFPNVTITGIDIKPCPQAIGRDRILRCGLVDIFWVS
jgi:ubiquinone/menaquinone biosynthesis C-methylase UbiE